MKCKCCNSKELDVIYFGGVLVIIECRECGKTNEEENDLSNQTTVTGRAVKVDTECIESFCEYECKQRGIELENYYKNYKEDLLFEMPMDFTLIDDELFMLDCKPNEDYGYVSHATKCENGSITFVVRYYNDGYFCNNALSKAIKRMNMDNEQGMS